MAAVQIDNCFGVGLKIPAMSVALSTAFHNYGHVCGERDGVEGSNDAAILWCIARRSDKAIGPSRRHPKGRWGLWTISAFVVVEDGQASSSSSSLDLASQAPSANVTVIMKCGTKGSVKNNFAELGLRFTPDLVAND